MNKERTSFMCDFRGRNHFCVFNCTSGGSNPITWSQFGALVVKYSIKYPSNHILMYPGIAFRPKNLLHRFIVIVYHFLPAFMIDQLLKLFGSRNNMTGIAKIIDAGIEANAYFTTREWSFDTANQDNLSNQLEASPSRYDFNCDAKCYDWDTYLRGHMLGIRQYLLKDPLGSLPTANRKLFGIYWFRNCCKLAFVYFLWSISHNYIFIRAN